LNTKAFQRLKSIKEQLFLKKNNTSSAATDKN